MVHKKIITQFIRSKGVLGAEYLDCSFRGDPHGITFAGTKLNVQGDCEYVLARDKCQNGLPRDKARFIVTATFATNAAGTRSWVTSVTLHLPERNMVGALRIVNETLV